MIFNKKMSRQKWIKEWKASWWMLAFTCFTYMLALKTSHDKERKIAELTHQLASLNVSKKEALLTQRELSAEIESFTDPAWVEMILMKKLGFVPQGHTKVCFKQGE